MATIFRDRGIVDRIRGPRGLRLAPPAPLKPSKPTKVDAIAALVSRHSATEDQAEVFVRLLERARDISPRPCVLSGLEVRLVHGLLADAVPSRSSAEEGSTHDLLNRVFLEKGKSFKHGMSDDRCSVVVTCI